MKTTKVFIVDDHPIVRRGLANFINSRKGFSVCGEAEDANTAVARINACDPDIAVIDIGLRDISGLDLIKSMRTRYPAVRVLVLTMHNETEYVERAILAGASGYVLKSESEEQIIEAMRTILRGGKYISGSLKDLLVEKLLWEDVERGKSGLESLTEREREVLGLLGRGYSSRRISEKLGLGVSTIGTYRERLKRKLGLGSNSELVRFAIKKGMD